MSFIHFGTLCCSIYTKLFSHFRTAASLSMVEVSLIMMVNLIVSSITMPKEDPFVLDAISPLVGDVLLLCPANFTQNILCARFAWNSLTKVPSKNRTTSLTAIPALKSFLPEEFLTFPVLLQPIASFSSGNFITPSVFYKTLDYAFSWAQEIFKIVKIKLDFLLHKMNENGYFV